MKYLKQTHVIHAPTEEVYIALTNPFTIELWSGYPAEMSTTPGSEFSMWEGDIVGKNLEFEENRLIKQQWYFDGQDKESIVTITLTQKGERTTAEVEHTNIPAEAYDEMKEGWKTHFFGTIKEFFK